MINSIKVTDGPLTAYVRKGFVPADNLRLWCEHDAFDVPSLRAIIIESVHVEERHRRQGHFKRFLAAVVADDRFDLVIVEGVQNPILAEALLRWDWECDVEVMDFHKRMAI